MDKPRVLVMSDFSGLHTGFATVSRNILRHLHSTGKYELAELGWFYPPDKEKILQDDAPRWEVFATDRSSYQVWEMDKYAKSTLPKVIAKFKPDIVLTIGDQWMTEHTAKSKEYWDFKWISYVPIDGSLFPPAWMKSFREADYFVAYCKWALNQIAIRGDVPNARFIWHGVDLSRFKILPDNERSSFRKEYFGTDDKFIVGCIARNQPRKQIPILFKGFALLVHPKRRCLDTNKEYIVGDYKYINQLIYTPTQVPEIRKMVANEEISPFTGTDHTVAIESSPMPPEEICLYLHMPIEDVGWDIEELINRFGLRAYTVLNPDLKIGFGVSVDVLAKIYSSIDIMALPTIGEGWGLPISEAMACGTPVVVTNYSAHTDFAGRGGPLIDVAQFYTEPKSNIERALADPVSLKNNLLKLYLDKKLRENYSRSGRAMAETMDWNLINKQWESLVDEAYSSIVRTGRDFSIAPSAVSEDFEVC